MVVNWLVEVFVDAEWYLYVNLVKSGGGVCGADGGGKVVVWGVVVDRSGQGSGGGVGTGNVSSGGGVGTGVVIGLNW